MEGLDQWPKVFGNGEVDRMRASALMSVRGPITSQAHSRTIFMLTHGKPVFLVSFSVIALKALRHRASRLLD